MFEYWSKTFFIIPYLFNNLEEILEWKTSEERITNRIVVFLLYSFSIPSSSSYSSLLFQKAFGMSLSPELRNLMQICLVGHCFSLVMVITNVCFLVQRNTILLFKTHFSYFLFLFFFFSLKITLVSNSTSQVIQLLFFIFFFYTNFFRDF